MDITQLIHPTVYTEKCTKETSCVRRKTQNCFPKEIKNFLFRVGCFIVLKWVSRSVKSFTNLFFSFFLFRFSSFLLNYFHSMNDKIANWTRNFQIFKFNYRSYQVSWALRVAKCIFCRKIAFEMRYLLRKLENLVAFTQNRKLIHFLPQLHRRQTNFVWNHRSTHTSHMDNTGVMYNILRIRTRQHCIHSCDKF